jgi:NDP-sugar pyrophosphorylase family protein
MVLAAGFGTRLAPMTATTPKPLLPVAGAPFLDHVLGALHRGGVREVVINLHHLGALIERHVGDGSRFGLRVRYSRETTILDTGGGIKQAERWLAGEPFFAMNGDSLLEVSLREIGEFHRAHGGIATLALRADPEAARYGLVEVDGEARVRRIVGLPPDSTASGLRGLMFAGLHAMAPEIFGFMARGGRFSITRDTYPALLARGLPIFGYEASGRWVNIDTPEALAAAERELRARPIREFP